MHNTPHNTLLARPATRRMIHCAGLTLSVALLAGCAAQLAYRDGRDQLAQGNLDAGLARIAEARALDPDNPEYRLAQINAVAQRVGALLDQAERALNDGQFDEAQQLIQRAQRLDAASERARGGLRALATARRHDALLREAEATANKNDAEGARATLRIVLAENPGNTRARELQRRLDDKTTRPAAPPALAAAWRKPITIEFKDAPLKSVFEVLARASGLNFVFDKDVRGDQKTTVFLKNASIESALNVVLLTNQLEQRTLDASTILVYPNTAPKQGDYQPLMIKSFYLANADPKAVANTLKTLLKLRDVVVDEKINLVMVRDSADAIRLAEKLVALQDVAEPEVMLEVEILEVSGTRLRELGVQWPSTLTLTPLSAGAAGTTGSSTALTLNDLLSLNRNSIGAAIDPLSIAARQQDSDTRVLANPRIRARNREKAKILIGDRVPVVTTTSTSTGFVSESINYLDVGLKLDVEPTVYADNEIAIKVALEVSNITSQIETKSGSQAYQIGTRNASTVLRLRDGENQVLAGLINNEDRHSANKVPGIGEIPVLGHLFGQHTNNGTSKEIVLSITPRLIRNIQRPDANAGEFEAGTENSLRSRSTGGAPATPPTTTPATPPMTPPLATPVPNASQSRAAPAENSGAPAGVNATGSGATSGQSNPTPSIPTPVDDGAAVGATTQLGWNGPAQLKVGGASTIQLRIQSGVAVTNVPLTLRYDPKVVRVTGLMEGDFLKQGGATTTFSSRIDAAAGQVSATIMRAGTTNGAVGGGVLATLKVEAVAPSGATLIDVANIAVNGTNGTTVAVARPAPFSMPVVP